MRGSIVTQSPVTVSLQELENGKFIGLISHPDTFTTIQLMNKNEAQAPFPLINSNKLSVPRRSVSYSSETFQHAIHSSATASFPTPHTWRTSHQNN